jgi:quercetin dioxygenase-like cupin family protein
MSLSHAPEAIWFLDTLTTVKAPAELTGGRFAVVEQYGPRGSGSPLHVHRRDDEWFYVIEGELTIWVGGQTTVAPAGAFAYAPRDVPHTFEISSSHARYLIGAEPAGFDGFVRAAGSPAESLTLPPDSADRPSPERLTEIAAEFGIEILGPPGIPA